MPIQPEPQTNNQMFKELFDQITVLHQRITELEAIISELKDKTKEEIEGKEIKTMEKIEAKNFVATGGFIPKNNQTVVPPYTIVNNANNLDKKQRIAFWGMALNNTGEVTESIQSILGAEINTDGADMSFALNQADWDTIKIAQLVLDYQPHHPLKHSFIYGFTTPFIVAFNSGYITQGTNVLVDATANFPSNSLTDCVIDILDEEGNILESHSIVSNSSNTITIDDNWQLSNGKYTYLIFNPIMLGSATMPFKRLYVGEMIRLGYGGTDTTQPIKIMFGKGSPEGVVSANQGSLYLRTDGGTTTTLYVKTSGSGNTGWTAK